MRVLLCGLVLSAVALCQQITPIPPQAPTAVADTALSEQRKSTTPDFRYLGSMAQLASGNYWKTTITLVNHGTAAARARLNFFNNSGQPLWLPITYPSLPPANPVLLTTVERTIEPGASFSFFTTGPDDVETVGWAQMFTDGDISGFAVFRQRVHREQEAVVPLETHNSDSYVLWFNNSGDFITGLAVANNSTNAASIPVIVRDEAGNQISTQTLELPAMGHISGALTAIINNTGGKVGSVEFRTPQGGQISALGLRFNGISFTTIPVLDRSSQSSITPLSSLIPAGSGAQLASGHYWETTITLVNKGSFAARTKVEFFDNQGNPLILPVTFPATPGVPAVMRSTVERTLSPGASLSFSSTGPVEIETVGSARLSSDGDVGGFAIFRQDVDGAQEALVPMETGNPDAWLLWFDNTGTFASGVAVVNNAATPASIPVIVRDEAGAQIHTQTVDLPGLGHVSGALSAIVGNTGGKVGSVEFRTPPSGAITVLGLRFNGVSFTTIPVMSDETSVTPPVLPAAPTLQATAVSSSQVHLSWTSTATGVIRFRIERRATPGVYAEITQPSAASTAFDDSGLTPSTGYLYRMRVESGAGMSPYSNEVTATTLQAVPAAPTNLQATAISSSQINLTWTNNAPDATAVRVEYQPPGFSTFFDIGAAASLTNTGVTNLQANSTYSFRVRAQNGAGYSAYSNVATKPTLPVPKTVFLIHGINQGSADMQPLLGSLTGGFGLDPTRFHVDAGFDFSECADAYFCSSNCSIAAGAQKLAQYIASANPPGDIVLIGYSMGGLIARDMMANGRLILNGRKISALVTLGTPNLGYPYTFVDTAVSCTPLVQQMDGNWRSQQSTNTVVLSPYLLSLWNQWPSTSYPGSAGLWLAASGRSCSTAARWVNSTTGCRDLNPYSDGVVCDDSAAYSVSTPAGTGPNRKWQDPERIYVHSSGLWGSGTTFVLCDNSGNSTLNPPLYNPPTWGLLFAEIKGLINGL